MKNLNKIFLSLLLLMFCAINMYSQDQYTPYDEYPSINLTEKPTYSENYPDWGKMLYKHPVNYNEICAKFDTYIATRPKTKNALIRYFKLWRAAIQPYTYHDGTIKVVDNSEEFKKNKVLTKKRSTSKKDAFANTSDWTFLGPKETVIKNTSGGPGNTVPWHVNVYSFDVSKSNNNILYAATETGFINKSTDGGLTWKTCAPNQKFGGGLTGTAIHPTNPNVVYVSSTAFKTIFKTTNGGLTWSNILNTPLTINKLRIDETNPNKVLASTSNGVYISIDAGSTWGQKTTIGVTDMDIKPNDNNIVYALTKNNANTHFEFLVSANGGNTFTADPNFPTIARLAGGLIATTPANPKAVYVTMLSNNGTIDLPYIYKGTYCPISNEFTWELTKTGDDNFFGFSNGQGYYDLVLEVAPDDENTVFWGTASLFKSVNGAVDFTKIGGYGGDFRVHPDIQDLKPLGAGKIWVATDGGMSYSTDYFTNTSNFSVRSNGVIGSDMWGYDQSWNEDIVVGGRYHNGNTAISDTYAGKGLRLGGAESPTGWIINGRPRQAAFDDLAPGVTTTIPTTIDEIVTDGQYPFTKFPNMAEFGNRRGSLLNHPNYHAVYYVGQGNSFWESEDMGSSWNQLYDFGATVRFMAISHKNPNVLYADVDTKGLYKSEDGGKTWVNKIHGLINPSWYGRLHFVISPYDENTIYLCYQKNNLSGTSAILKSTDGGTSWVDWSGTVNTNKSIKMLAIQPTKTGQDLLYMVTRESASNATLSDVYHRKEGVADWELFNTNLPVNFRAIYMAPFYKKSSLRLGGNAGVWESPLVEPDFEPPYITPWAERPVHKVGDQVYLEDHSMINHTGVSWEWIISPTPQSISDANIRNPIVVFDQPGVYTATLKATKNGQVYTGAVTITVEGTICDAPAPLLHYNFEYNLSNEGSSSSMDLQLDNQTSNTGSLQYTAGKFGNAYDFDGTNTLTSSGVWNDGPLGTDARSITAWIKVPAATGIDPIITIGAIGVSQRYALTLNDQHYGRIAIQGNGLQGATAVNSNEWVHVAVSMPESGTLGDNIIYVNGVQYATDPANTVGLSTQLGRVLVGAHINSATGLAQLPFVGQIDDLRVYDCALSKNQIVNIMNNLTLNVDTKVFEKVFVYPVPTSGTFNVSLPTQGKINYSIYAISGKLVHKGEKNSINKNYSFNIESLPSGLFLFKAIDEKGIIYRTKIIKQ